MSAASWESMTATIAGAAPASFVAIRRESSRSEPSPAAMSRTTRAGSQRSIAAKVSALYVTPLTG